jgi:hypothetical protein
VETHLERSISEARLGIFMRKAILWAVIERYEARLAAQEAGTDGVDSLEGTVPGLASVRAAVKNLEISQLDMQAAILKGLLIPMELPLGIAENSEITCRTDTVVWTRQEMLERLVDV